MKYKIVLASQSPRRKQLLEQIGFEFEICPSNKEEIITSTIPEKVCVELSEQKALDVAASIKGFIGENPKIATPSDLLIIGADTIVAVDGEILGKPIDEEDAYRMLCKLSGNTHCVYTGVTFVFVSKDGRVGKHSFFEATQVTFYDVKDEYIKEYIESGEPMDKAGSYGIQGKFARHVKCISGDYYNIVGLPVGRIHHELEELGVL